ncbi:transmembrane protein, putative (macronuclear) [Tetrahymena thermophila SB210]|uniref:Transmembrane protein, putative n=1 Tax=Tetrahymena thermophila (strain SB210) TaxID=312017 RepID=Q22G01_TETTS|nr:transmembrane protein, putative [Tetrahymena thermophila SB210]EAR84225.1 transmembrane protein, putative [Tetrahymena thermophila SB210]|eukprot:XP_001031888.1 transmembrane protein, putative [Tetrahymena thermophila SB210]
MKYLTLAIISLIAISFVNADTVANCTTKVGQFPDCVNAPNTTTCSLDTQKYTLCIKNSCDSNGSTSTLASCITTCGQNLSDATVLAYIKNAAACLNSSILALSLTILSIFALIF